MPKETKHATRMPASANSLVAVTFGNVTVNVRAPTEEERKKRISESNKLIQRLRAVIPTRGVKLAFNPLTPVYSVDYKNPDLVICKIGRRITRGAFKDGVFVEVNKKAAL